MERWLHLLARRSRLVRLALLAVERERRRRGYLAYYRFLHRPDYSGARRFAEAVREIKAACDAASAVRVCAILFPLLHQDLRPGRYEFRPLHEAIAAVFREAGIPLLDLYPAMAGSDSERLQAIPMMDHHPNEIAHRIAAEELFFFLLERGMIEPERAPRRFNERDRIARWHRKLEALGQPPPAPPRAPIRSTRACVASVRMPCSMAVYETADGVRIASMNAGLFGRRFGGTIARVMGGSVDADPRAFVRAAMGP